MILADIMTPWFFGPDIMAYLPLIVIITSIPYHTYGSPYEYIDHIMTQTRYSGAPSK